MRTAPPGIDPESQLPTPGPIPSPSAAWETHGINPTFVELTKTLHGSITRHGRALMPGSASTALRGARSRLPGVISRPASSRRWQSSAAETAALSPRWLSDVKQRIGACITFGLQGEQRARAGGILQEIARDWRELVAGSEGYLTSADRRGMFRREVVWGEMDSMGHVNNVVYNRYAESGRIGWAQKFANHIDPTNRKAWTELWSPTGTGLILRTITTEFKFPMKYPDHISIYHKLRTEPTSGTDSFRLDVLILSELHQRAAARCIEDVVVYDYTKSRKTPLKPFMIDVFRETWRLQEEAKRINSKRVLGLLERVKQLEKDSWDKEDAVEDMGSAG